MAEGFQQEIALIQDRLCCGELAFPCATIQQPKEKVRSKVYICVLSFPSATTKETNMAKWVKPRGGEKRTMHLWMTAAQREPAKDEGGLPCALPRNGASPKLKWLYARGQFPPQVPATQVSLSCPSVIFSTHLYTSIHSHTLECSHTHTHTATHTLRALAALTQCPCPAKHLVQTWKALTDFSEILQALPKVWPSKPPAYSSSSSSSSGSGSNSSFRHSL